MQPFPKFPQFRKLRVERANVPEENGWAVGLSATTHGHSIKNIVASTGNEHVHDVPEMRRDLKVSPSESLAIQWQPSRGLVACYDVTKKGVAIPKLAALEQAGISVPYQ